MNPAAVDSEIEEHRLSLVRQFTERPSHISWTNLACAVMSTAWNQLDLAEPKPPSWKLPAEGYGVSTVIHLLLLVLLSIFTFVENPLAGHNSLTVNWNADAPSDALEPDPVQPPEYQPRAGGSQSASVAFLTTSTEFKVSAPDVKDADSIAVDSDDLSSSEMATYVGALFGLGGNGTGDGTGDGEGSGFFGKPGSASSFVFVLDRSGSMNRRHIYSGNLSRFQRLKLELIRFIDRLKPTQKFYVIFFDEQAHPMPAQGLVEASDENKEQFIKWVTKVGAGGRTDPRAAVKMAMLLNPDQIYFLSDGEIVDIYRLRLMQLPASNWKLNTYSFGQDSEEFMKVFAEKHNGKYTYIP